MNQPHDNTETETEAEDRVEKIVLSIKEVVRDQIVDKLREQQVLFCDASEKDQITMLEDWQDFLDTIITNVTRHVVADDHQYADALIGKAVTQKGVVQVSLECRKNPENVLGFGMAEGSSVTVVFVDPIKYKTLRTTARAIADPDQRDLMEYAGEDEEVTEQDAPSTLPPLAEIPADEDAVDPASEIDPSDEEVPETTEEEAPE